jgi:hypothetical protein
VILLPAILQPVSVLLDRLGLDLPIVQAGMGGGLAGHELAGAVSAAGGLGTIGMLGPAGVAPGGGRGPAAD